MSQGLSVQVVGDKAGRQLEKAQDLGVTAMPDQEFAELIARGG